MPDPDSPLVTLVSPAFSEGTLSTHNFGLSTPPARIERFDDVDGALTDYDSNETVRTKIEGGWHGFDSVVSSATMAVILNSDVCKGDIDTSDIFLDPPEALKGKINLVPAMTDVIGMAIWTAGGEACTNDKKVLKAARDKLVAAKGAMGLDRQRQL